MPASALFLAAALLARRSTQFADIPAELRPRLGITHAAGFDKLRSATDRDTST